MQQLRQDERERHLWSVQSRSPHDSAHAVFQSRINSLLSRYTVRDLSLQALLDELTVLQKEIQSLLDAKADDHARNP